MNVDFVVQGLSLDISVLEALLKRSRNNHGRALYYRRLAMASKSMNRNGLLEFGPLLLSFQKDCKLYHQKHRSKKRVREEQWGEVRKKDDDACRLQERFAEFETSLMKSFPEVLSRIQHASLRLFTEVNRGFFLPFCTVALSALARIRALIQQMGCWGVALLKEVQTDDPSSLFSSKHNLEKTLEEHYMEPQTDKEHRKQRKEEQTALTLSSMGLHFRKSMQLQAPTSTEATSDDPDHNDLAASGTGGEMDDEGATLAKPMERSSPVDDDIGESVGVTQATKAAALPKNDDEGKATTRMDPIDQNLGLVNEFKKKNKSSKNKSSGKKKDKKRKSDRDAPKEKKKKKKKDKGGDYFDELFS